MDRDQVIAGRYRLDEKIGEGGMGVVWRATDLELRRTVAVKQGSQMRREGCGGAGLLHPNVIAVFDVVGENWLIMEYLPSRSLAALLGADGPLPAVDVARIGRQIASALAAMHDMGMVHRDVTPGNILVTADRTAKLTDFGIAVWESVTQAGDAKISWTPGFAAPEVVKGHRATPAADIHALGATLSAAVEGAEPDPVLAPVLTAMLAEDPDRRPTAAQVRQSLNQVVEGRRRSRWPVYGLSAVALVAVLALIGWLIRPAGHTTAGPPPATTTSAPAATDLVGDPRTADPCSIADANSLARYGPLEQTGDYGEFNRCDTLVYLTADQSNYVDVEVRLDAGAPKPGTPVQQAGQIGIQRPVGQDRGSCTRVLVLPGRYLVSITAKLDGAGSPDLCGMADAMTTTALIRLSGGPLARRVLPANSLAGRDACALLDTATVIGAFGPGPVTRTPGLLDWQCDWSYPGPQEVKVWFDRTSSDSEDGDAVTLAGHNAFVEPPDADDPRCQVAIVYRTYTDDTRERTDERVMVDVQDGTPAPADLCAPARSLATVVAQRLFAPAR